MPTTMEALGIDQLNPEQRLELIGEIWDSLSIEVNFSIPTSHKQELDRRLAEADAHPDQSVPWDEVRQRLWSDQ